MPSKKIRFRCTNPKCKKRIIIDKACRIKGRWIIEFAQNNRIKNWAFIQEMDDSTGLQCFVYNFCPDCFALFTKRRLNEKNLL